MASVQWLFCKNGREGRASAEGGHDGELDVVGINFEKQHLLHVECSLDSLTWEEREPRFEKKFARGRSHIKSVFVGCDLPEQIDQVAVLQYAGPRRDKLGGGRLLTTREFVKEILGGIKGTPAAGAVPSNLPLIRTLQLAADLPTNFADGRTLLK